MLLRELVVAFFGSELIVLVGLSLLLLGTALGALAARAPAARGGGLAGPFLLFAALLPTLLVLVRGLRPLARATPGADLPFAHQLAAAGLLLVPLGALGGALFRRAAGGYVARGHTLATAYGVESAGGLAGGLAATLLLALGAPNLAAGLLAALLACAAALLPAPAPPPPRALRRLVPPLVLALALACGLAAVRPLDRALTAWSHPALRFTRDTPYGRATVTGDQGQVALFENGALAWESEGTSAEELVHVAALASPAPRAVLVLGGALEGLPAEVLRHAPARVDVVELDRALVAGVLPLVPAATRAALAHPALRLTFADPRRFLDRPARYDLVLIALGEPVSGQANRYYTREFFAACARRMAPEGVLALRLAGAENLWTPALARRTASIQRALAAVFASVVVLPGSTQLLLASPAPLARDPELLGARLAARGVAVRLVTPAYLRYLFTNERVGEFAARLAATAAPENRDARPICYQYTLVLWLARYFPVVGLLELPRPGPAALAVAVALALLVGLAARRREGWRRALLVAAAGFVGMVIEGVLILAYQVRQGVLFQDLGLLLALFMAGLAAGALAAGRCLRGRASRRAGAAVVLATAAVCAAAGALVGTGAGSGLAASGLMLAAAGATTGALFAFASLARVTDPAAVVAPLYAADLAGGSLGSLAGSLFLLPVLGLPATALLLAGVALGLLLLV